MFVLYPLPSHPEYFRHVLVLLREAVGSSRYEEGSRTYSRGSAAGDDPVPLHPGNDPKCRQADLVGFLVEIEVRRKSVNEQGRVYDLEPKSQDSSELEEARPEGVDVDPESVAEVDQHVLTLLLPARDVQARRHDVHRPTALDEVPLQGHHEKAMGRIHEVRAEANPASDILYPPPPPRQRRLPRLAAEAVPRPPAPTVRAARALRNELTNGAGLPAGPLLELHGRDDGVLLHHHPALGADGRPGRVVGLDLGRPAVGASHFGR